MEFWSAGMGKKHLAMGLDKTKYEVDGEEMILTGVVDAPADWNYKVTMTTADWANILKIATSSEAGRFLENSVGMRGLMQMASSIMKFTILLAAFKMAKVVGISGKDKHKEGQGEEKAEIKYA